MKLSDIINLPAVWTRLMGQGRITSRGTKRLVERLADRERKFDVLKRLGLGAHAVENLYDPPLDPKRDKKNEDDLHD